MNTKTRTRIHLNILPLFAALVLLLSAAAARADDATRFNMDNYDIYSPGDYAYVNIGAYNLEQIEIRVYKLEDPTEFFKRQPTFGSPRPRKDDTVTSARALMDEFGKRAKTRYRGLVQRITKKEVREAAVKEFGLDLDGPKTPKAKNVPLLSEKDGYELVKKFDYKIDAPKLKQWSYRDVKLGVKDKGAYLVESVAGNKVAYTVVLITDLRFIDKSSDTSKLIYVCDGKSGRPVQGASVTFFHGAGHQVIKTTDEDGVVRMDHSRDADVRYVVSKGADFVAGDFYYWSYYEDRYKVYVYTDRPVYRPGHEVQFKAILREVDGLNLNPVRDKDVTITVLDSDYEKVLEQNVTTGDLGALDGKFALPAVGALGRYHIEVSFGEEVYYGHFKVEEYRKPEYKVTVTTKESSYVAGDGISAEIDAQYFFGEPVAGAEVSYTIYRARYWVPWWNDYAAGYQYGWYYAGDEYEMYDRHMVDEGEAVLDKDGKAHIALPTGRLEHDAIFYIVANVTDKNRHAVSGSGSVKVSRGLFIIHSSTPRYSYAKGSPVRVDVSTKTIDGKAVATDLKVSLRRRYWVKLESGEWDRREEDIDTGKIKIGKSGKTAWKFTPEKTGSYEFVFSGRDARGNILEETGSVYVYDGHDGWYFPSDSGAIEITADKKGYAAGDTAKLLIATSMENATLLITLEGKGIYEHKVVTLDGANTVYDVKLKPEYAPNVFVNVSLVADYDYYQNEKELVYPPVHKFLDVDIATDKKVYSPGEKAQISVLVKDSEGRPVKDAELSLGVVDEAIYSISKEIAPDIKQFFYDREYNRVQTEFSYGFYTSGYSRTLEKVVAHGGDRVARADFKHKQNPRVRRNFKDTMHWAANVRTGADGRAVVTAECPDNLTTWRVTVRAMDAATRVGQNFFYFKARKNLIMSLGAPRFFREKDTVVVATTVHNYFDTEQAVKVSLDVQGATVEPSGEHDITIPAKGTHRLDWSVKATPGAEKITFLAKALAGPESDILEFSLPYLPFGIRTTDTDFVEMDKKSKAESLDLSFSANTELGNADIRVEIAPTPAGGIFSSLDYLISYPYGCTEQTMNSFMPNVIVSQALKGTPMATHERFKELPDMMKKGLDRLYNYQHSDGGWGWWEDDETRAFMTAYVVYGLSMARDAGYDISESVLQEGADALKKLLGKPEETDAVTRAYMVYALAVSGDKTKNYAKAVYQSRNNKKDPLNVYGRALLAMTLKHIGLNKYAGMVADEIIKKAEKKNGRVHWGGGKFDYRWQNDVYETTAQCVRALSMVRPKAKEILGAVRWLVSNRPGGSYWRSTRDTAIIVLALLDYTTAAGTLDTDVSATVRFNGGAAQSRTFTKDNPFAEPWVVTIKGADLKQANTLAVDKTGAAPLYVTVTRSWFDADRPLKPQDNGVEVTRKFEKITPVQQNGEWVYRKSPIRNNTVHTGDEILVTVKVRGNTGYEYFMLEDFFPAGCEVIRDTSGYNILDDDFRGFNYNDSWRGWFRQMEVRDQKVSVFSSYIYRDEQTMQYILRAEIPGEYNAMPAAGNLMYYPEVGGRTGEYALNIVED